MAHAYNIPDDHLLLLWKNGDEQAFAAFYTRHFLQLVNMATQKLHSHELAEELVQDIFMALYRNRY